MGFAVPYSGGTGIIPSNSRRLILGISRFITFSGSLTFSCVIFFFAPQPAKMHATAVIANRTAMIFFFIQEVCNKKNILFIRLPAEKFYVKIRLPELKG